MNVKLALSLILLVLAACAPKLKPDVEIAKDLENAKATFFAGEVKPAASKPCFAGAYYRKLVSSTDDWLGIEGVVVLPYIKFDENRKHPAKAMQYMDNPSVYFGGNMDEQETDIGLTWEVIKDEKGNVTKDRRAFRPFLRRNEYKDGQPAVFENAPAKPEFYWYPGEEVKMSVKLVADKTLRFTVAGAGKKFERDFACNGFTLGGKAEYKRVNAIDQVGNEGRAVTDTKTQVMNAVWKNTNLYRLVAKNTIVVPFHSGRYTEMMCPSPKFFKVKHSAQDLATGAETLSISGNGEF